MDIYMEKEHIPESLMGLADVEGISVMDGLRFCGGVKDFEQFLDSFYEEIEDRASELEIAYERGDIPFFTIKVHALKTCARIIGAKELSAQAAALEKAGKAEDIVYIEDNKDEMLELLRSYKYRLKDYMDEKARMLAEKLPISDYELGQAFDALKEIGPTEDFDALEMILTELKRYRLDDKHAKAAKEVEHLLRNLDWDGLNRLLKHY